ncbi:MAG: MBL fold metallo-hydrolase, partial [Eubacteriales bacterium]|nr:MBL fold metallo-hydrolase [Eubacteriales bacterium]
MNCDNIKVNTQSSIRIEGSKVVYFDPFQIGPEPHDADLICITHDHYDHFDPASIF